MNRHRHSRVGRQLEAGSIQLDLPAPPDTDATTPIRYEQLPVRASRHLDYGFMDKQVKAPERKGFSAASTVTARASGISALWRHSALAILSPLDDLEKTAFQNAVRTVARARGVADIHRRLGNTWAFDERLGEKRPLDHPIDADQATPPDGEFTEIAAGHVHTCARREDGTVTCWGDGDDAALSPPPGTTFETIDTGLATTCGIAAGEVVCWGDRSFEVPDLGDHRPVDVSLGHEHLCVRSEQGLTRCTAPLSEAFEKPGTGGASHLTSGTFHACAVIRGRLECHGVGERGEDPDTGDYGQAYPPEFTRWTHVTVGGYQGCLQLDRNQLDDDQSAVPFQCWGGNQRAIDEYRTNYLPASDSEANDQKSKLARSGSLVAGGRSTCTRVDTQPSGTEGVACWRNRAEERPRPSPDIELRTIEEIDGEPAVVERLDVGGAHYCITVETDSYSADTTLMCFGHGSRSGVWEGAGDYNQAVAPILELDGLNPLKLGERHSCLDKTSRPHCWGIPPFEQTKVPSISRKRTVFGPHHGCWLENGSVACKGSGTDPSRQEGPHDFDQAAPPDGQFRELAAGRRYTCGIRQTSDRVVCWGNNDRGQLEAPEARFVSIDAAQLPPDVNGYGRTCGVTVDHEVHCWGARPESLQPLPTYERRGRPEIMRLDRLDELRAGPLHTCGLDRRGHAGCWGYHFNRTLELPADESFQDLTSGLGYTCGVRDDATVACHEQHVVITPMLERFFELPSGQPASTAGDPPPGRFAMLAGGTLHACGLQLDGTVVCWGQTHEGQLQTPSGPNFTDVAAGLRYGCALDRDGKVTCWGERHRRRRRRFGRSDEDANESDMLTASTPETTFERIAGGPLQVCGIRSEGGIECWGETYGSPPSSGAWQRLAVGLRHACAIGNDGSVRCWGGGEADDVDSEFDFGQAVPPEGSFERLTAGLFHTCGIREDGAALCWGLGTKLQRQEHEADFNQGVTPSGKVLGVDTD